MDWTKGWTKQEIANKIDWEGGLEETLRWGLRVEDMPEDDPEVRLVFEAMFKAWKEFDRLAKEFLKLLPEPGEEFV